MGVSGFPEGLKLNDGKRRGMPARVECRPMLLLSPAHQASCRIKELIVKLVFKVSSAGFEKHFKECSTELAAGSDGQALLGFPLTVVQTRPSYSNNSPETHIRLFER